MRREFLEIREFYSYCSYEEFEKHFNEMISKGFRATSPSSEPKYYVNKTMDDYSAEYSKKFS